ncbi:hypothetical protein Drorol1_Dr00004758 [Drosera rotundifolia]
MGLNFLDLNHPPILIPQQLSIQSDTMIDDDRRCGSIELRRYIDGLDDESKKLETLKRELPFSIHVLNDVINYLKQEAERCRKMEVSLSGKRNYSGSPGVESELSSSDGKWFGGGEPRLSGLNPPPCTFLQLGSPKKEKEDNEGTRLKFGENGGALTSFQQYVDIFRIGTVKKEAATGDAISETPIRKSDHGGERCDYRFGSLANRMGSMNKIPTSSSVIMKKQRRNWSPELHRQFVDALEKLGGPQEATPKNIRELMPVDGLTNDEVKSHLQKYRLHCRRVQNSSCRSPSDMSLELDLQLGMTIMSGKSQSGNSHEGPLQLTLSSTNSNSSTSSSCESMMEEDRRSIRLS